MGKLKLLILLGLFSLTPIARGQVSDDYINYDSLAMVINEAIDGAVKPQMSELDKNIAMIMATDRIITKIHDYPTYRFVYEYIIAGFAELNANRAIDYMLSIPNKEVLNLTEDELVELREIGEKYDKLRIGAQAPDIHAVTIKGKAFDLKDVKSEMVLILFWSEGCPHCRNMLKELSSFTADADYLTIVTVCATKDLKKVKKALRKSHLKGYHICDGMGWESPVFIDYNISMTPSMYLIGKNKEIVAKPFDVQEFISIIEK